MKRFAIPLALLAPVACLAQVTVNPNALEGLKPSPHSPQAAEHERHAPTHRESTHRESARREPERRAPSRHERSPATQPAKPAPPRQPATVAPSPPPAPVLPPAVPAPAPKPANPPPPPPIPLTPDAQSSYSVVPGGVRVLFEAGKADINQTTLQAIQAIGLQVKDDPNADINIYAYASGPADDPSAPRRLSLSRALAARAVLIAEGIPSPRIYVRALGATAQGGPLDRVDVVRSGFPQPDAK